MCLYSIYLCAELYRQFLSGAYLHQVQIPLLGLEPNKSSSSSSNEIVAATWGTQDALATIFGAAASLYSRQLRIGLPSSPDWNKGLAQGPQNAQSQSYLSGTEWGKENLSSMHSPHVLFISRFSSVFIWSEEIVFIFLSPEMFPTRRDCSSFLERFASSPIYRACCFWSQYAGEQPDNSMLASHHCLLLCSIWVDMSSKGCASGSNLIPPLGWNPFLHARSKDCPTLEALEKGTFKLTVL